MAKVTLQASTPDSWSRRLEKRTVVYDPLHAELIGYGCDDDEQEDTEDAQEDYQERDESPENSVSQDAPEPVEMENDSDDAGPSGPPIFSPAPPEAAPYYAPPSAIVTDQGTPVTKLATMFRQQLENKTPTALKAFEYIAFQARPGPTQNPAAVAAVNAIVNAAPPPASPSPFKSLSTAASIPLTPAPAARPLITRAFMVPQTTRSFVVRGEVVMGGQVSGAVASLIKTVLSPVAWVTHGAGTMSKAVGNTLESLARKL